MENMLAPSKPVKFTDIGPGSTIEVTDLKGGSDPFKALVVENRPEFGPNRIPALVIKVDGTGEVAIISATGKWAVKVLLDSKLIASAGSPNLVRLRSLPVEISAIQFTGGMDSAMEIIRWAGGKAAISWRQADAEHTEALLIGTLEGEMAAAPGVWVMQGTQGEFYPCKDDVKLTRFEEIQ